jgi:hypothetical protein
MRAGITLLLIATVALGVPAWAADAPSLPAAGTRLRVQPVRAAESAVVRFGDLARADAARRLLEGALAPLVILQGEETAEGEDQAEAPNPASLGASPTPRETYPFPVPGLASLVPSPLPAQSFMGLDDIPRVGTNTITIPPDVDGAVGPDRILEGLNNNYRLFDKATGAILGTAAISTFWAATGAGATFDPKTLYDPVQQRWIAVALSDSRTTVSSVLIGVSQSSDPNGAWNLFRVLGDSAGVNWVDFPNIGFNKNWIAINVNLFTIASNTGNGSRCLIVDYAQARAGTFAGSFANGTGFCSSPVATASPAEPTLYVPTHLTSAAGTYRLDTITGPVASPVYTVGATRSRGTTWTQPTGAILPQAPPLSGSSVCGLPACAIETQDAQIRSTPVCRDGSIWYAQTIGLPAGGLTHTAVQWTRLEAATGNVLDGGRIDEPTATASNGGKWYAYPHVAVNGAGNAIVCFSEFSSTEYPAAGYAVRFGSDAAGTLREPVAVHPGEDYYHKDFGSGRNRWGDYAKAQVDPADDQSLWVVAQYARARIGTDDGSTGSNSSRWGTWWARIGPMVTIGPGPVVDEGDSGSTPVSVPVTLSQPLAADLTVGYVASDGTATLADGDYDSPGTAVVFPAGTLTASIPLNVHGDRKYEGGDETFTVTLVSAPGVALAAPAQVTVTIHDTDPVPALSVSDLAAVEGDAGGTPFAFTVSLSNPSYQTITAGFATADSTATTSDHDYVAASGTVTFPPGVTTQPVAVTVNGDIAAEFDEIFLLDLSDPVNATIADRQGLGQITNDDALPSLSVSGGAIVEGNSGSKPLWFRLTLSKPTDHPVSVQVTTRDGSAKTAAGDYASVSTVRILPAFTAADSVAVMVNGDLACELDETFKVALASITGALPGDTVVTATILNDDNCAAVEEQPIEFGLASVAPNPAVAGARIGYALPHEAHVRLAISDLQGRTLAVLVDGVQPAGRYSARWDGAGPRGAVAAGVYFVRFEAGGKVATQRFAVTH